MPHRDSDVPWRRTGRLAGHARNALLALTQNERAAAVGERVGMRLGARRFIAGETLDECLVVLDELASRGLRTYTIILGESVQDASHVQRVVETYVAAIPRLAHSTVDNTLSVKLTNLGQSIDDALARHALREILAVAAEHDTFVRIDMEESARVDATLDTYRQMRAEGWENTGVALQAYLHRTADDLRDLADLRPNVRIVKGAYLEPGHVAVQAKHEVDRRYSELVELALDVAAFTAIATHDDRMIDEASKAIASRGRPTTAYEFQLLHGVRPTLQDELVRTGHPVRVCVPYGTEWFVYFGRRLAERPANLLLIAHSLVRR